ncbi:hypothetical protein AB0P21_16350 [Kribbella sp. NPDC056861]|uniref:hypothetical protein n=1 Tax=Kribbella sp. NPDC056861 TaxID=3154857 RepID=UPI00341D766D
MNLDDLRAQLQTQATEIDSTTPVPIPTIRRRTTTLRRRRAATAVAGAAAAVALVVGVLPNAVNNSAPDPAKPPANYTRDGIVIPGAIGSDWLDKAEIAVPGRNTLEFDWTPTSTSVTFRPYCRTTATRDQTVRVTINGRLVLDEACDDTGGSPRHLKSVPSDHTLWLQAPPGQVAKVRVFAQDLLSGEEDGSTAGLALGIYRSVDQQKDPAVAGLPVRTPAADPGDYVRDGFRFPAKVAGDPLIKAVIGDLGTQKLTLRFQAVNAATGLRPFCTANDVYVPDEFSLKVSINGRGGDPVPCSGRRGELAQDPRGPSRITTAPGQTVEVTVQVVDSAGKTVIGIPDLRIGVGAYSLAPRRFVESLDGTVELSNVIEYGGYTYKVGHVRTAGAATSRKVTIETPADKPYLIAYGGHSLDKVALKAKLTGLKPELDVDLGSPEPGTGLGDGPSSTYGQPAGPAGEATLSIVDGQSSKGLLYLAIYVPE